MTSFYPFPIPPPLPPKNIPPFSALLVTPVPLMLLLCWMAIVGKTSQARIGIGCLSFTTVGGGPCGGTWATAVPCPLGVAAAAAVA